MFKTISDFALFTDITQHIWHRLDESEAKKSLESGIDFFSGHSDRKVPTDVKKIIILLDLSKRDEGRL